VGLVGCGRWGVHILRDLVALGCTVDVVARSAASRARARDAGARTIVERLGDLRDVEGLVVATPTSTHAGVVAEALEHEVPVFVEKPLCTSVEDAETLLGLEGGRLFVMDKWRYHAGIEELARIARAGSLGRVTGLRTTRAGWGNQHDDVDAIWILLPHDLSIGLEVLGRVLEPRAATAEVVGGGAVSLDGLLGDGGLWQVVSVSARAPRHERRVELHAEHGVAVLGGGWDEHIVVVRDDGGSPVEEHVEIAGELPLLAELRAFVGHLRGGPPPRSSAADGAITVQRIVQLRSLAGHP